jgi:hypothetical protein
LSTQLLQLTLKIAPSLLSLKQATLASVTWRQPSIPSRLSLSISDRIQHSIVPLLAVRSQHPNCIIHPSDLHATNHLVLSREILLGPSVPILFTSLQSQSNGLLSLQVRYLLPEEQVGTRYLGLIAIFPGVDDNSNQAYLSMASGVRYIATSQSGGAYYYYLVLSRDFQKVETAFVKDILGVISLIQRNQERQGTKRNNRVVGRCHCCLKPTSSRLDCDM